MLRNDPRRLLRAVRPADSFDKVAFRIYKSGRTVSAPPNQSISLASRARGAEKHTHQVKINTMIDQVVHPRLHALRRAEVHAVHLAHRLDLLPRARQPDHAGVELLEVGFEDRGGIASGIAGDEDGEERRVGGRARWERNEDEVQHLGHFVELFRTDVGAVGEAEVDLEVQGVLSAGVQRTSRHDF